MRSELDQPLGEGRSWFLAARGEARRGNVEIVGADGRAVESNLIGAGAAFLTIGRTL